MSKLKTVKIVNNKVSNFLDQYLLFHTYHNHNEDAIKDHMCQNFKVMFCVPREEALNCKNVIKLSNNLLILFTILLSNGSGIVTSS